MDDGEPRVDGVTIFLDADGDGAHDDDEASTVTGPNKTDLRNWLRSANATNMAYMLSVQLAAMQLNVLHGFVDPGAHLLVTNPDGTKDTSRTVSDIMSEANAALLDHGLVLSDSPYRPQFESLKNALDDANNNLNFVVIL